MCQYDGGQWCGACRSGVPDVSQRDEEGAAAKRGYFTGHRSSAVRSLLPALAVDALVRLAVTQNLHPRPHVRHLLRTGRSQVGGRSLQPDSVCVLVVPIHLGRVSWRPGPPAPAIKYGPEVMKCVWCVYFVLCRNKCIYHMRLGRLSPYVALTISTISRGGVKVNVHNVT